jgi:hypothetical protein
MLKAVLKVAMLLPCTTQNPAMDGLVLRIATSNVTSEEKFQQILAVENRRYCGSANTCLNPNIRYDACRACSPCRCDDQCVLYGDCCPDKLTQRYDQVTTIS